MVLKSSLTSSKISAIPARFWLFLYSFFWLLLLCWLAFFNNMGSLGLMDKTEALFVEIGNQMLKRGDWITPWWNGKPFFDYPVWGFWMVALSFQLFGVSEWSARLPVALAASSVVVAAFALLMLWPPAGEDFKKKLSSSSESLILQELSILQDLGDLHGECKAHGNMGAAHFSKGNYKEALTSHR